MRLPNHAPLKRPHARRDIRNTWCRVDRAEMDRFSAQRIEETLRGISARYDTHDQAYRWIFDQGRLTIRLSDARERCRKTKLIYPHHRPSPWSTEATPRDRSKRVLEVRELPPTETVRP